MSEAHPSRTVSSAQDSIHPRLDAVVARHLQQPWQQPLHTPTVAAFERLQHYLVDFSPRLVLDSGCGTGESTRLLAAQCQECTVIGVDKSTARLSLTGKEAFPAHHDNAIWLRADLASFWRLALLAGWKLERHYLLYPNPWPKAAHLRRRWHGHPVFPTMLALGGQLEMRSNWSIYAEEFARAASLAGAGNQGVQVVPDGSDLSPFERKYRNSGHALYRVVAELTPRGDRAPG